jgi:hypothetical protein
MCAKLREEGFQCLSLPTPLGTLMKKPIHFVGVDIQKPLWLEGETCPLGIDCDKYHPSFESQLLP